MNHYHVTSQWRGFSVQAVATTRNQDDAHRIFDADVALARRVTRSDVSDRRAGTMRTARLESATDGWVEFRLWRCEGSTCGPVLPDALPVSTDVATV